MTNLLWSEGFYIVVPIALSVIGAVFFYRKALWCIIPFFLFTLYFFRNPDRTPDLVSGYTADQVIFAPADGRVVAISSGYQGDLDSFFYKIEIFLSPFDVHVNRAPVAGTIANVAYKPGSFTLAFLPKSSEKNERNDIDIVDSMGRKIKVRQIAGAIARKIVCWVAPYDRVGLGDRIGMIRFGSRVDIFLPKEANLRVSEGDYLYGGQTAIATWHSSN